MKFLKNKLLIGILCIAIGLSIGFLILPKIDNTNMHETKAVRTNQLIEQGTIITDEMLEEINIPSNIASNTVNESSLVIGKYAITNIYDGDFLTENKLSDTTISKDVMKLATQKGKRVISIKLPSLASGVSGRLLAGDIVSLIATPHKTIANISMSLEPSEEKEQEENTTIIFPELQFLEVCMLTTSKAYEADVKNKPTEDDDNILPITISFFVTEEQAIKIAELEQNSTIHIAFVARGENVSKFIPIKDLVLTEMKVGK